MVPRLILLLCTLALVLFGVVMIYSASSVSALSEGSDPLDSLVSQLIFAGIGTCAALVVWKVIPLNLWRYDKVVWAVWVLMMLLLLLTAIIGTANYGAQRWLYIGSASIQPSEFAKLAFILMAVRCMSLYNEGALDLRNMVLYGGLGVAVPLAFLLVAQSDMGTTAICLVGIVSVLWLGGFPAKYVYAICGVAVLGLVLVIALGAGYRSDRFLFLNPWNDGENGQGAGYQLVHSYYALAGGGLTGLGLGNSHEKYLYLPFADTDFIFAVVGEELGLVGAVAVIAVFLLFLYAGLQIARQASDAFGGMVAGSFSIMIVFQAFLNIGCVIGVFPTTGKPLPFISAGGSSLVATMLMVGFILAVSEEAGKPSVHERRRADFTLVRNNERSQARGQGHRAVRENVFSRAEARPAASERLRAVRGGGTGSEERRRW